MEWRGIPRDPKGNRTGGNRDRKGGNGPFERKRDPRWNARKTPRGSRWGGGSDVPRRGVQGRESGSSAARVDRDGPRPGLGRPARPSGRSPTSPVENLTPSSASSAGDVNHPSSTCAVGSCANDAPRLQPLPFDLAQVVRGPFPTSAPPLSTVWFPSKPLQLGSRGPRTIDANEVQPDTNPDPSRSVPVRSPLSKGKGSGSGLPWERRTGSTVEERGAPGHGQARALARSGDGERDEWGT